MAEIEFLGETFQTRPKHEYEFALCDFAEAAEGVDAGNLLTSYRVVKRLLRAAIVDEDFDRFWALVEKNRVGVQPQGEEPGLMTVGVMLFWQSSERPTGRPSDSSDGPPLTSGSSGAASSAEEPAYLRVVKDLEAQGRPTVALMVLEANESTDSKVSA